MQAEESAPKASPTTEELDAGQYTPDGIRVYEAIFGEHFISSGGAATARKMLELVDLKAGMDVLDVGCGIGGLSFLLASEHQARVYGVDLSGNMVREARQRLAKLGLENLVSIHQANILDHQPDRQFDLILSRDTFLHIHDKMTLFSVLRDLLKPGGALLFSDYLSHAEEPSAVFADYIQAAGYDLRTLKSYQEVLESVGLVEVQAWDQTDLWLATLKSELESLPQSGLEAQDIEYLAERWQGKISRVLEGEQGWGWFRANRSAD